MSLDLNCLKNKLIKKTVLYLSLFALCLAYIYLCSKGLGFSCIFQKYLHIQCLSCGATRAFLSMLQFDFVAAVHYNALFTLIVYPILFFVCFQDYCCAILGVVRQKPYISLIDRLFSTNTRKRTSKVGGVVGKNT